MWDYNEEYKAFLRRSAETLRWQVRQWHRDVERLNRLAMAADGLRLNQLRRRSAFYLREAKALVEVVCACEAELCEQEKWGLPGLMFSGAPTWDAVPLGIQAGELLTDFLVRNSELLDRERSEMAAEAKREARKADKRGREVAARKLSRRRAARSGIAKGGRR